MQLPRLESVFLYRMTHIDNVPHILRHGIVHESSANANPAFTPIGDSSLISHRRQRVVATFDGKTITLGDFIPFYFGVRMPMLYIIQHGFNAVTARKPGEIVYLVVPLLQMVASCHEFYFSDGHATDGLTQFFNAPDLRRLPELLDWNAINAIIWSGNDVPTDTKRRKQAEFLVRGDIPPDLIYRFLCYDEAAQNRLIAKGVSEKKIQIFTQAYY